MAAGSATTLLTKITCGAPASSCSSRSSSRFMSAHSAAPPRCSREASRAGPVQPTPLPLPATRRRRTRRLRNPPTRVHRPIADRHPATCCSKTEPGSPAPRPWRFEPTYAEVVFTTNLSGYQESSPTRPISARSSVMTAAMIGNYASIRMTSSPTAHGSRRGGARALGAAVELAVHGSPGGLARRRARPPRRRRRHASAHAPHPLEGRDARRRGVGRAAEQRRAYRARREPVDGRPRSRDPGDHRRRYTEGPADAHHHIVAYDYGMKRNILRLFLKNGCRVTVVPAATPAARIRELAPDVCSSRTVRAIRRRCPTRSPRCAIWRRLAPDLRICLGHQLLVWRWGGDGEAAVRASGGNHPVAGSCDGTSTYHLTNHGFAVRGDTGGVRVPRRLRSRTLTSTTAPSKG